MSTLDLLLPTSAETHFSTQRIAKAPASRDQRSTAGPRPRGERRQVAPRRHASPRRRPDTKAALLDRAERLFATHGFEATSVRAITGAARANLGAVNYHFRSKKDLIVAVLRRRIRPLNERRVALLDEFACESAGRPLRVERVIEALFRPPLELIAEDKQANRYFVRLIAHCFADSGPFVRPLIEEELSERNRCFHAAIKRALPYLSDEEIQWRLHFADGVFLHTIANAHVLEIASRRRCRFGDVEKVLTKMIAFCAAGFQARSEQGKGRK